MKLTWFHGEDSYEEQANKQGYTLSELGKEFEEEYKQLHNEFIFGYRTYTQHIKALKRMEKRLNKSVKEKRSK